LCRRLAETRRRRSKSIDNDCNRFRIGRVLDQDVPGSNKLEPRIIIVQKLMKQFGRLPTCHGVKRERGVQSQSGVGVGDAL
jgi:hypothetical protein